MSFFEGFEKAAADVANSESTIGSRIGNVGKAVVAGLAGAGLGAVAGGLVKKPAALKFLKNKKALPLGNKPKSKF